MSKQQSDQSKDLVADPEYMDAMVTFLRKTSEKAELQLNELLVKLETVNKAAIISGEMAKSLEAFISLASQMKDKVRDFGYQAANLAREFQSDIRDLDRPAN